MNAFQQAAATGLDLDTLVFDARTASLLDRRRGAATSAEHLPARSRGWLVRRALLVADAASLISAYLLAKLIVSGGNAGHPWLEFFALVLTLPLWVVAV